MKLYHKPNLIMIARERYTNNYNINAILENFVCKENGHIFLLNCMNLDSKTFNQNYGYDYLNYFFLGNIK